MVAICTFSFALATARDVVHALGVDRVREDRRRRRAVTDRIARSLGRLTDDLHAEVLLGILELHTIGVPQFFPMRTLFDFGPSVTRTASASAVAPRRTFSRASARKSTFL
jgi:hypothetical protein